MSHPYRSLIISVVYRRTLISIYFKGFATSGSNHPRVLLFAGRKLNLAGSTLKGQADIDMLLDLVADFVAVRFILVAMFSNKSVSVLLSYRHLACMYMYM